MIKIKVQDLVNSTTILQKLSNMSLKARLAWQIARLLKAADEEIQAFNDTRMKVIKKYGEKDENDQLITDDKGNCKIPPENMNKFTDELNELLSEKVSINADPIDFKEIEDIEFTPAEMTQLTPFVNMDDND